MFFTEDYETGRFTFTIRDITRADEHTFKCTVTGIKSSDIMIVPMIIGKLLSRAFEVLSGALEMLSRALEVLSRALEVLSGEFEVLSGEFEVLSGAL